MTYAAAHLNALVMTVQCQACPPPPPTPLHRMPDSISTLPETTPTSEFTNQNTDCA